MSYGLLSFFQFSYQKFIMSHKKNFGAEELISSLFFSIAYFFALFTVGFIRYSRNRRSKKHMNAKELIFKVLVETFDHSETPVIAKSGYINLRHTQLYD